MHAVVRIAVMRQDAHAQIGVCGAQPLHISGKRLAYAFVVVQDADFLADELDNPDCAGVCLGSRPADVPICALA